MSNILVILVSLLQNPSKAAEIIAFTVFRLEMTDTQSSRKGGLKNGKISYVTMEPSIRKGAKTRAKC